MLLVTYRILFNGRDVGIGEIETETALDAIGLLAKWSTQCNMGGYHSWHYVPIGIVNSNVHENWLSLSAYGIGYRQRAVSFFGEQTAIYDLLSDNLSVYGQIMRQRFNSR